MQYWYAARGNSSKRGLADELVLFEMAKNGKLKPSDLVWSTTTGSRWVPASTIEGLFHSATQPAPSGNRDSQAAPAAGRVGSERHQHWVVPVIVTIVMIAFAAVMALLALKFVGTAKPPPKADFLSSLEEEAVTGAATGQVSVVIAAVARSNVVADLRDRIAVLLVKDRLDEAEKLIGQLTKTDGGAEFAERLSLRLDGLKRTALRKSELEVALRAGTLDKAGAEELLTIVRERKEEASLQTVIEGLLRDKGEMTSGTSLSVARLCAVAGWQSLQKSSLREFSARAPMSGPDGEYLEVVQMYNALGDPAKGADLLAKYLANSPQSSAAWLELAAIRCSSGDPKAAMTALKQAVDRGGNEACANARRDSRFDSVRDTRAFRSLIGIK